MGLANRLLTSAQALAALAACVRLDEQGLAGDPAVRAQLDRVLDELGMRDAAAALEPAERAMVVSFVRSYLAQALDLVDDPAREGAWSYSDPALLHAQGAASAAVARLVNGAGLGSRDARILDVGTGVGGLAIAFCASFPDATVVGIDPWEPALALARENVAAAGLDDRVTLLRRSIQDFDDPDGFDLVWLPSFFIPEPVLDDAIERVFAATRRGGTAVVGAPYPAEADPLAAAVDDLVTVRSGGSVLTPQGVVSRLQRAGFTDTREIERTWDAPLRLVTGRRG